MAIAAHPDDVESWCAGTLARAVDGGATVRLLLVTSGEKGSDDPEAEPAAVGTRREREATEAAARLGLTEVAFLRLPDGEVEETGALRRELVSWIRRWRPDVLFTHDPEQPWPPYLSHRDHRVVGRAALDAVYPLARDRLAFPEQVRGGLAPTPSVRSGSSPAPVPTPSSTSPPPSTAKSPPVWRTSARP